jgi:hypothetical protein
MANTGYIINPKVIQIFTSGPNSGSEVTSSFNIEFDSSSSFTSSFLCNNEYLYKIFDPINCPIVNYCIEPSLISSTIVNPLSYDYLYNITYNSFNITSSIIEYSLSNTFNSETGSLYVTNSIDPNNIIIDISTGLNSLPINCEVPIYFRMKNICGLSQSLYSNTIWISCPPPINPPITQQIFLTYNRNAINACALNSQDVAFQIIDVYGNPITGLYKYIDTLEFVDATTLHDDSARTILSPPFWYSDGNIARYWNGSSFTQNLFCL